MGESPICTNMLVSFAFREAMAAARCFSRYTGWYAKIMVRAIPLILKSLIVKYLNNYIISGRRDIGNPFLEGFLDTF